MLHRGCLMLHRGAGWLLAGRAGHRDPVPRPLGGKVVIRGAHNSIPHPGLLQDARMQDARLQDTG